MLNFASCVECLFYVSFVVFVWGLQLRAGVKVSWGVGAYGTATNRVCLPSKARNTGMVWPEPSYENGEAEGTLAKCNSLVCVEHVWARLPKNPHEYPSSRKNRLTPPCCVARLAIRDTLAYLRYYTHTMIGAWSPLQPRSRSIGVHSSSPIACQVF